MSEPVIVTDEVSRSFGQVVALNEISLTVEAGVVGLLGPNGAGKSTLLKVLTGELRPGRGKATVFGLDPYANPEVYRRLGLCPEQDALFDDVSGREFVAFLLNLRGYSRGESRIRGEEWLDRLGLSEAMNRRIGGYSKGMRQRAKLATAFAHEPELILLDEPLTGLDPIWRHRVQGFVREAADRGATVLFSSHVLHEVEQATRNVVLLHQGRIAAQGDAREIRSLIDQFPHRVLIETVRARELAVALMGWDCVESARLREGGITITTPRPDVFYERLTEACAGEDLGVDGLQSPDDSLQALFETLLT